MARPELRRYLCYDLSPQRCNADTRRLDQYANPPCRRSSLVFQFRHACPEQLDHPYQSVERSIDVPSAILTCTCPLIDRSIAEPAIYDFRNLSTVGVRRSLTSC